MHYIAGHLHENQARLISYAPEIRAGDEVQSIAPLPACHAFLTLHRVDSDAVHREGCAQHVRVLHLDEKRLPGAHEIHVLRAVTHANHRHHLV
jgi:hypothetical protein